MLSSLKNMFKVPDLRNKVLFTLLIISLYQFGANVPVLVMQGSADPYGTLAQVRAVEEECYCPVETVLLPGVGHAPHRERPDETLAAIAAFTDRIFRNDDEGVDSAA